MTELRRGDIVTIRARVACPGEIKWHGIRPYCDGRDAVYQGLDESSGQEDHVHRVLFLSDGRPSWFARDELELRVRA